MSDANELTFKLQDFEGPLDLLLHLIRKSEMDIYDIQITTITSQYLESLHKMKTLQLDIAGEYLVLAATLMTIKSKMLLPKPELDDDVSDVEEVDPRADLVDQLLEYKRYKQAADDLRLKQNERQLQFTRSAMAVPDDVQLAQLTPGIKLSDLQRAFEMIVKRNEAAKPIQTTVTKEDFTIKAQMETVLKTIAQGPCQFTELFSVSAGREELVTTFLAVLELAKDRQLVLNQGDEFGPINVSMVGEND